MEFDNTFEVPLPPAEAWPLLMDIERIAPSMPGARLTGIVDPDTCRGEIAVRLGPVALTFAGTVRIEARDAAAHVARVRAEGRDAKGRGGAHATATFRIEPAPDGSRVLVHTNLDLSGAVAQYGRGVGVIQASAAALMTQFADNLRAQIGQGRDAAPASAASPTQTPKPMSGFALMLAAMRHALARLLRRTTQGLSSRQQ